MLKEFKENGFSTEDYFALARFLGNSTLDKAVLDFSTKVMEGDLKMQDKYQLDKTASFIAMETAVLNIDKVLKSVDLSSIKEVSVDAEEGDYLEYQSKYIDILEAFVNEAFGGVYDWSEVSSTAIRYFRNGSNPISNNLLAFYKVYVGHIIIREIVFNGSSLSKLFKIKYEEPSKEVSTEFKEKDNDEIETNSRHVLTKIIEV